MVAPKSKTQSREDVFRCSTLKMWIFQWDSPGTRALTKDRGLRQHTASQEKVNHFSVGYNHKQQAETEPGFMIIES